MCANVNDPPTIEIIKWKINSNKMKMKILRNIFILIKLQSEQQTPNPKWCYLRDL